MVPIGADAGKNTPEKQLRLHSDIRSKYANIDYDISICHINCLYVFYKSYLS